jgi:hypothetical protein
MQGETGRDYLALVCELTTRNKLRINVSFEINEVFNVGLILITKFKF